MVIPSNIVVQKSYRGIHGGHVGGGPRHLKGHHRYRLRYSPRFKRGSYRVVTPLGLMARAIGHRRSYRSRHR